MNIRLNKEQKIKVLNSDDLYKVMQQVLLRQNKVRRNQEYFWVIGLDDKSNLLFVELIGIGTYNRVNANPSDIFRIAIYKLATRVILCHNHPSSTLSPSKTDIDFTDKILKAGKIIDIDVIDHLIITEKSYVSFENEEIMKTIRSSGMYEIMNMDKKSMIDLKVSVEKDRLIKETAKKIAKKLKDQGMDEKLIKKMTGLYIDEVREL